MVYARKVGDKTVTLTVSGMLWNRSLVMQDEETGSLWSHILGEAMRGPLKGRELTPIPSAMTDWKTWREGHPDTTVVMLSRTSKNYRREFYKKPARFVLGVLEGGEAASYPFDALTRHPVVNDELGDELLLIVFLPDSKTAMVYRRTLGEKKRLLTFESRDGEVFDRETSSRWDPFTGRALAGKLKGKRLTPVPGVVSYRRVWEAFHPDTRVWKAEKPKPERKKL